MKFENNKMHVIAGVFFINSAIFQYKLFQLKSPLS